MSHKSNTHTNAKFLADSSFINGIICEVDCFSIVVCVSVGVGFILWFDVSVYMMFDVSVFDDRFTSEGLVNVVGYMKISILQPKRGRNSVKLPNHKFKLL